MDYPTQSVHIDVSQYNDTHYPYYDATFQQQQNTQYSTQDGINKMKIYQMPLNIDMSPVQSSFMNVSFSNTFFPQDISMMSCLPTPGSGISDGVSVTSEVYSDISSPSEDQSSYFPMMQMYQQQSEEQHHHQQQTFPIHSGEDSMFNHYDTAPQVQENSPSITISFENSLSPPVISPLASPLDNSVLYSPTSPNASTLYRKRLLKARADQQQQYHQKNSKKPRASIINPPSLNTPPAPSLNPDGTVHLDCNGRKPRQWRNRKYRCSHCDLQFYDRDLDKYAAHIEHVEATEHPDASGRRFKCPEQSCPWSKIGFARKLEQVKHHTRKHGNPTFECRFWAPDGAEKFPGACVCTTHWHADSGNRLRHERAVHGAVWSDEYEAKYQAHQASLAAGMS